MNRRVDLHIHVGCDETGRWVKIPSSRRLTVRNILETAARQKGLDAIGLADSLSPLVQADLDRLLVEGILTELPGGGYRYGQMTVLLGAEVETREQGGALAHSLLFLPALCQMRELSGELKKHIKNINLSSQNTHMDLAALYAIAKRHRAKIVPAHVFTPFKSVYGSCAARLKDLNVHLPDISALEIGLSADLNMAARIGEVRAFPCLANSDAHSLANIAREFTEMDIAGELDFTGIFAAVSGQAGKISALYGLNPQLGKYYLTRCADCGGENSLSDKSCRSCGGRVVAGVKDRIGQLADLPETTDVMPYHYHLPLAMLPGLGAKTLLKIYRENLTELGVLYDMSPEQVKHILGERVAALLGKRREIGISAGGAGRYGQLRL